MYVGDLILVHFFMPLLCGGQRRSRHKPFTCNIIAVLQLVLSGIGIYGILVAILKYEQNIPKRSFTK